MTSVGLEASRENRSEPILETRGLSRDFDRRPAVRDLGLSLRRGEIYGFLGPNGAGKTTTIRMLTGLLRPTRGEMRIDGLDWATDAAAIRAKIGWVPDTPPLFDYLTGRQYVAFVGSLWGVPVDRREEDGERWLRAFDLLDRCDDICKAYSHGMRKKVHLAAVLATRPSILFLDEPTTGLDPGSARTLKDAILDARREGTTVFLSTHVLDAAQELCDRIGILAHGSLLAQGSLDELCALGKGDTLEQIFLALTRTSSAAAEGTRN